MSLTEDVRTEHQLLLAGVELLREAGDAVGTGPWELAEDRAEQALAFLTTRLIPHAREEEELFYRMIASIMNCPEAPRTMVRDHVEVARLTRQLEWALQVGETATLRRLLYGLYHIARLHVAKEEEIYLPLLQRHMDDARTNRHAVVPAAVASHAG